jgi:hypothetical protein
MRLISFDVGIKNMAYCIIDNSENNYTIVDWNIIDCSSRINSETPSLECNELLKNKCKCKSKAKYFKNDIFVCEKHAKLSKKYFIGTKEHEKSFLNKKKINEIQELFINTIGVQEKKNKNEMINSLLSHYNSYKWDNIVKNKQNASKIDLISIGRNLNEKLNLNHFLQNATHVIIENQISPIANRMKTIQGMIAQHFISLGINHIEFVSSGNKLKELEKISNATTSYKQNKQDGIIHCNKILEEKIDKKWTIHFNNSQKKDDLADCFLQAIWFIEKNKQIN